MKRWIRIRWLRWVTRNWRAEDHDMCLSFMGPCCSPSPSCEQVIELRWLEREATMPRAIARKAGT